MPRGCGGRARRSAARCGAGDLGADASQRVLGADTGYTVLRLNYHPGHARCQRRFADVAATPGAKAGAILRHQGGSCLGTPADHRWRHRTRRDRPPARPRAVGTRRRRGGRAATRPRRWALLVGAGWLVQAGLRAWFSRAQAMPLANPDETAYLIAARVLAGGPAADFSGSTLYQGGYPLLITPVYWFTSNPSPSTTPCMTINAAISAALMPLGYLACRRLGLAPPGRLRRGHGRGAAAGRVLLQRVRDDRRDLPGDHAGLAAGHAQLAERPSPRGRYAAATGPACWPGTPTRSTPGAWSCWPASRRSALHRLAPARRPRLSVAVAALTAGLGAGWALNRHLSQLILYPEGTRSLTGQTASTLKACTGSSTCRDGGRPAVAAGAGQLGPRRDRPGRRAAGDRAGAGPAQRPADHGRALGGVTVVIACVAPAALPPDQSLTWASGRYLDGMIVTFFLVGAVVLLRARPRPVLVFAGLHRRAHRAGRGDGGRLRRVVAAHRRLRDRVQLRRACRADPELDQASVYCWPRRSRWACSRCGSAWPSRARRVERGPACGLGMAAG